MPGARSVILSSMLTKFWTCVTSFVRRVTRDPVENLSIFAKEKVWMLLYIAFLRFFPKPAEALDPHTPPMMPVKSPASARSSMIVPVRTITGILPWLIPLSMIVAINSGIRVSTTTSRMIKTGVTREIRLYSFTSLNNVLNTSI